MRSISRRLLPLIAVALLGSIAAAQSGTAPESFTATMQRPGGAAAGVVIRIDRYTDLDVRTKMTTALKYGGYPAFLEALRAAPAAGSVTVGDVTGTLRWTKEEAASTGRLITAIADAPLPIDADGKPAAAGRDAPVTVIELRVDRTGHGTGRLVPAARLTQNAFVGASIDAGAGAQYVLTAVTKTAS